MPKYKTVKKQGTSPTIFPRFMFVVAVFVIWIGVIGVRLVHLQVNEYDSYRSRALSQRRVKVESKTLRGSILDRFDRALAFSTKVKSLFVDPRYIDDVLDFRKSCNHCKSEPPGSCRHYFERQGKMKNIRLCRARKLDDDTAQRLSDTLKEFEIKIVDGVVI